MSSTSLPPAATTTELDRRLKWSSLSIVMFGLSMVLLASIAGWALLAPPRIVTGLPADDAARAAQALLGSEPIVGSGHLRFQSALTGESAPGFTLTRAQAVAAARAESLLNGVVARHRLDARGYAALGHLDLARRLLERAIPRYQRSIELSPHFGEARVGLAVALALKADATGDPLVRRSLRLQALAQCIAVDAPDPAHEAALYDQAWLSADVGRMTGARRAAERYWAIDPSSAWAERLRARIEGGSR